VELKRLVPDLVYDFRYATPFNFTGKRLYPVGTDITFLRLLPALALQKITDELRKEKLVLKIFDAYPP
jgi:D-alanyl-D-alanine dipeptidase